MSSGEAEELEMHVLDEVELAVFWLMVDLFWVIVVLHLKHLEKVRVSIVMATQEAIFLTTEPALAEGELRDVAMLGVDLELDVVLVVHVLLEALGLGSKEPKDFLFGFYHGFALAV